MYTPGPIEVVGTGRIVDRAGESFAVFGEGVEFPLAAADSVRNVTLDDGQLHLAVRFQSALGDRVTLLQARSATDSGPNSRALATSPGRD